MNTKKKMSFACLLALSAMACSATSQNLFAQNETFDHLRLVDGIYTVPTLTFDSTELFGDNIKTEFLATPNTSLMVRSIQKIDGVNRWMFPLTFDRRSSAGIRTSGRTSMTISASEFRLGPSYNHDSNQLDSPWLFVDSRVDNTPGHAVLAVLANNGGSSLRMENTNTGDSWQTSVLNNGDYRISLDGSGGHEFRLLRNGRLIIGPGNNNVFDLRPNGNLIIGGTLVQSSDRSKKENFSDVDCQEILKQVTQLPIQSWNYKTDEDSIRHIGPMAQDFFARFKIGMNNTTIATVDTSGVTMAAIKALDENERQNNQRLLATIEELESRIANWESKSNMELVDQVKLLMNENKIKEKRITELESSLDQFKQRFDAFEATLKNQ